MSGLRMGGPMLVDEVQVLARGTPGDNPYGEDPRTDGRDYLVVSIHEAS
jgi:hypothetical protein